MKLKHMQFSMGFTVRKDLYMAALKVKGRNFDPELLKMWFTYHVPDSEQAASYTAIRDGALRFAKILDKHMVPSADATDAMRKLREVVMTANASIACSDPDLESEDDEYEVYPDDEDEEENDDDHEDEEPDINDIIKDPEEEVHGRPSKPPAKRGGRASKRSK